jgi:uncharacterized membrane protein YidH (DUF202 family)
MGVHERNTLLKLKFIYAKITQISIIFSLPHTHRYQKVEREMRKRRQEPKMPMLRMPFSQRVEFIFGHDDIYQNFY